MKSSKIGSGKTTDLMKTKSTFTSAGWDFTSVWTINDGADYPKLAWQPVSPPLPRRFGGVNGKIVKLTLKDCDGNDVTFSLTGGGYGEVNNTDCTFSTINLFGATEKSALTISTKSKIWTSVGDIICDGPMKSITAKTAKLSGNITISPSSDLKATVAITVDRADNLTIDSQMPVKSITATEWHGGSLKAPSVGSITAKGDKKRGILGDLYVDVEVDGTIGTVKAKDTIFGDWICNSIKSISVNEFYTTNITLNQLPDATIPALGSLTANWMYRSQILSQGNIGKVTIGDMTDSVCFAGVAEGITGLPPAKKASFPETATIKSIAIKGIKSELPPYFINSNIAAANILSVSVVYPKSDNGGVPFGLSADSIKKLTIKKSDGTTASSKDLVISTDSKTIDGVEIRLY
jgi:hypothetical protein